MRNTRGITLIALIITIIVLLILAGIVLSLTIGKHGIINRAKQAGLEYEEKQAREKLELALVDMQVDKIENSEYNQDEYLAEKLEQEGFTVEGNVITVGKWQFEIDRSILQIVKELGEITEKEMLKPMYVPILNENNSKNIILEKFYIPEAYKAFDGDESTYVATRGILDKDAIGAYIGYDFEVPVRIIEVMGKIRMLSYKIQYSDDLQNWTDVITANSLCTNEGDTFTHTIEENVGKHRYWCLRVNGGQQWYNWAAIVWSLQFYTEYAQIL